MRTRSALLALCFVSIGGCSASKPSAGCPEPPAAASVAAQPERERSSASPPTLVFVVRHAEKADDGTPDPPLLPAGVERADCLAQVLRDVEVTHLFATDLQRTSLTVQPLATASGLTVEELPASDIELLAETLRALPAGSVAVVAGHSNSIPSLTQQLGAPLAGLDDKGNIPDTEYDRLIALVLSEGGRAATRVPLRYCAP